MNQSAYFPATGMPDDDWWNVLWPDPKSVLIKTGIKPGMTIVDLCCGNGHFTASLASLLGGDGMIFAIDVDSEMLNTARVRTEQAAQKEKQAPCLWIQGDACLVDKILEHKLKADGLIIANTFHGVPDQKGLSQAVSRVLKPSGIFVIINWHALPREETVVLDLARGPKTGMRMAPQEVARIVEPAGFVLKEVVELPPYHYGAVFQVA